MQIYHKIRLLIDGKVLNESILLFIVPDKRILLSHLFRHVYPTEFKVVSNNKLLEARFVCFEILKDCYRLKLS